MICLFFACSCCFCVAVNHSVLCAVKWVVNPPHLKGMSRSSTCTQPNSYALHLLTPKAQTQATKQFAAIWALMQCRQPINMQILIFCLFFLSQAQLGQACNVGKSCYGNETCPKSLDPTARALASIRAPLLQVAIQGISIRGIFFSQHAAQINDAYISTLY